jgi:hypothetical protein
MCDARVTERRECAPFDSDLPVNRRSSSCDEIWLRATVQLIVSVR